MWGCLASRHVSLDPTRNTRTTPWLTAAALAPSKPHRRLNYRHSRRRWRWHLDACVVVVGRRAGTVRFVAWSGEARVWVSIERWVSVGLFIGECVLACLLVSECWLLYWWVSVGLLVGRVVYLFIRSLTCVFIYSLLKFLPLTLIIADSVSYLLITSVFAWCDWGRPWQTWQYGRDYNRTAVWLKPAISTLSQPAVDSSAVCWV